MGIYQKFASTFGQNQKQGFFYFIREIFIITFGVMIAIALNNWNQERNLRKDESHFMEQYRETLVTDRLDYLGNAEYGNEIVEDIRNISKYLNGEAIDSESLGFSSAGFAYFYSVPSSMGRYEELKRKGLGFIHDDTLRQYITQYYESDLLNTKVIELQLEDIREDLRSYYSQHFTSWTDSKTYPLNIKALKDDNVYKSLIIQKAERVAYLADFNLKLADAVSKMRQRICQVYGHCT